MKTLKYQSSQVIQHSKKLFVFIFLITLFITTLKLSAQTSYQTVPATSSIKVDGSSNLHDWTMKATTITSSAAFSFKEGKLNDVTALSFAIKVKDLKSDEDLLNSRAYKAMNADKYPTITFKLSSATVTPLANGHFTIKASGKLQISGVTKDIVLYADAVQNTDKTISCTGSEKLQISNYGIAPPSFMLGALKVKNDVSISYNLKFKD
jgi:polyisoprenoid-binding protein YceI